MCQAERVVGVVWVDSCVYSVGRLSCGYSVGRQSYGYSVGRQKEVCV